MNIRIASLDLFSIIFPGIIACLLFLPLLPNALRELLYNGNEGWMDNHSIFFNRNFIRNYDRML